MRGFGRQADKDGLGNLRLWFDPFIPYAGQRSVCDQSYQGRQPLAASTILVVAGNCARAAESSQLIAALTRSMTMSISSSTRWATAMRSRFA